ncbi:MAG: DUF692 domain-containing protein [Deltaproteobacteria bacterium]|nr:DUF692 domain-containing protein [Deltaproteobacteria bacterium]
MAFQGAYLGHGVGLRPPHYTRVIEEHPAIDWFEIISENFLAPGGNPRRVLRLVRERYPVVMHGVGLSIGSVDPIDDGYLDALAALAFEVAPAWISDHLCWSSFGGHSVHDLWLWPMPLTEESLAHVVARVAHVQDRLGRPILLENVSSYLAYRHSTIPEWSFLAEVAARTGYGLLLDVNNVYVSARNQRFDPETYVDAIPAESIGQIHLAGHSDEGNLLLDTHDRPVCDPVWELYRRVVRRAGRISTLIEWDEDIPSLERAMEESRMAAAVEAEALRREVARSGGSHASCWSDSRGPGP